MELHMLNENKQIKNIKIVCTLNTNFAYVFISIHTYAENNIHTHVFKRLY